MIDTPEEAISKIKSLGFPDVFVSIWDRTAPRLLSSLCQRPVTFFKLLPQLRESFPRLRDCVPLWEENREAIVALDSDSQVFIRYYYGDTDCDVLGRSYQQLVSAFLVEMVYSGRNEELEKVSSLFSYRHLAELKAWAAVDDDIDAEESKGRFVESIRD
jgi:hypothetical protein